MTTPTVIYDDIPEATMETIYSDPLMEYVLVPGGRDLPPKSDEDDDDVNLQSKAFPNNRTTGYGGGIFQKVLARFIPYSPTSWLARFVANAHMSAQARLQSDLPTPSRASTIYKSYDWVSEVIIDEKGGRLILPGQLVTLGDDDHFQPDSIENVPAAVSFDSSSFFGSSTIMVSAHDLLATQTKEEDYLDIEPLMPPVLPGKTFSKRLWRKLHSAKRTIERSGTIVVDSMSQHMVNLEHRLHLFSMTSDIIITSYDWFFPAASTRLSRPDDEQVFVSPPQQQKNETITIEMTRAGIKRIRPA